MTSQQIRILIAVAMHGSFSAAAKELFLSQPSVSRQIGLLEQELGYKLFERGAKNIVPTNACKVLCKNLIRINAEIDAAVELARNAVSVDRAVLRVGCVEALSQIRNIPYEVTNHFKKEYSDVELVYSCGNFGSMREQLFQDRQDLILTYSFDVENNQGIEMEELYKTRSSFIIGQNHRLYGKEDLSPEDFKEETFIVLNQEDSSGRLNEVVRTCNQYGYIPKNILYVGNNRSLRACLHHGLGVSICADRVSDFEEFQFRILPVQPIDLISVVAVSKVNAPEYVLAFRKILKDMHNKYPKNK